METAEELKQQIEELKQEIENHRANATPDSEKYILGGMAQFAIEKHPSPDEARNAFYRAVADKYNDYAHLHDFQAAAGEVFDQEVENLLYAATHPTPEKKKKSNPMMWLGIIIAASCIVAVLVAYNPIGLFGFAVTVAMIAAYCLLTTWIKGGTSTEN
jgi:hypothetical protein